MTLDDLPPGTLPAEQVVPPVQRVVQFPQCSGSLEGSMQAPLQASSSEPQPQVPEAQVSPSAQALVQLPQ